MTLYECFDFDMHSMNSFSQTHDSSDKTYLLEVPVVKKRNTHNIRSSGIVYLHIFQPNMKVVKVITQSKTKLQKVKQ